MDEKTPGSPKFGLEQIDCADDALKHFHQRRDDWSKPYPPAFLKSYLRNEICFCLKLRVTGGHLQVDGEDYFAVFSNLPREIGRHSSDRDTLCLGIELQLVA